MSRDPLPARYPPAGAWPAKMRADPKSISAFGKPHDESLAVIRLLAIQAARRDYEVSQQSQANADASTALT